MLVKRYRGKVVKRMRRAPSGILLRLLSSAPGVRGAELVITQDEWKKHGTESCEPGMTLAKLREQLRNSDSSTSS
jgi:hypothetical protein